MEDRSFIRRVGFYTIVLVFCFGAQASRAADRVALVIGNGAYRNVSALPNPTNDAADIAESLQRLNFSVMNISNANANQMRKALIEFGRAAQGSEMALVFYAGHGIEVGGENWLIPVDAELLADTDTENEAISLKTVTLQVSKARQLGLVILDACRNNPFAATMQRSLRTRAVARGLAPTEPTDNVLVAFAAKDGTTAADGNGSNSPFTTALLRNLETPGLEVTFLFRNVRDEVMELTGRAQQPFVYGSLSKDAIYFKPAQPGSSGAGEMIAPVAQDELLWNAVKNSKVAGLYDEFLRLHPTSTRAPEAKRALERMQVAALSTGASPLPVRLNPYFSEKDAQDVADVAERNKLAMPAFEIMNVDPKTPSEFRRFLGVWMSKVGYGGKGRQAMLIVKSVGPDGQVDGFLVHGPPTKNSFSQTPSGFTLFSAKIQSEKVEFSANGLFRAITFGGKNTIYIQDKYADGKTTMIHLEPVWSFAERAKTSAR